MSDRIHLQNYYTETEGRKPNANDIEKGEIAINTADEILFMKNKNNEITEFIDKNAIQALIDENKVYLFNPEGTPSEEYAGLQDAVNNGKQVVVNLGATTPYICSVQYEFYAADSYYIVVSAPYINFENEVLNMMYTTINVSQTSIDFLGGVNTQLISAVDNALNIDSTNPVQNKVILEALGTVAEQANNKQAQLVSGTNIKTINGESILGSGDIEIEGGNVQAVDTSETLEDVDTNTYVKYVAQTLTDEQKAQVRTNIGIEGTGGSGSDITVDSALSSTSTNPVQNKVILAALNSISDLANSAVHPDDLAAVATSGSYNDLSDKPTIPSVVTPDWIQNNSSADDYIKSRTHYVNGVTISAGGTYSVGRDVTQLYFRGTFFDLVVNEQITLLSGPPVYATINSAGILTVTDAGGYLGAYPLIAVRSIVPLADMYIPNTVVRTSGLKTINGTSILGSGDITIEGGSGGSSAYSEVSHGTSDTTFTLTPNVFHIWDEVSSLTLTLGDETDGVANEFLFQFNSGSEATTLSLPDTIKWANDYTPTMEANKIYQISILKGLASALVFDNAPEIITFKIDNSEYQAEEGMTWEEFVNSVYNTNYLCQISGNYIRNPYGGNIYLYYNSVKVLTSDIIIAGVNYNFS